MYGLDICLYFNKSVIPNWSSWSFSCICSHSCLFCLSHWQLHLFLWFRSETFDSVKISLTCRPWRPSLALISKYVQNPILSHYLYWYHPRPSYFHLSLGLLVSPLVFSASVLGRSAPVKALKIVHNELPILLTVQVKTLQCFTRFYRIWPLLCLRLHCPFARSLWSHWPLLLLNHVSLLPYEYFYTCCSLSLKCSSPHGSLSHLLRLIQRPSS